MSVFTEHKNGIVSSTLLKKGVFQLFGNSTINLVSAKGELEVEQFSKRVFLLNQVHGNEILKLTSKSDLPDEVTSGDGWFIEDLRRFPNQLFGVLTADCLPVVMLAPDSCSAAILHCGWKPVAAGLVEKATTLFSEFGILTDNITFSIGPGIGKCCFEVSSEVGEQILSNLRSNENLYDRVSPEKINLDLASVVSERFIAGGGKRENIYKCKVCTYCNQNYFSYRREGKLAGRQLSVVGFSESSRSTPCN